MKITIEIPQNIIDVCLERGWELSEIVEMYKDFLEESPMEVEDLFFDRIEDLEEED
jgi:hypothetical protein